MKMFKLLCAVVCVSAVRAETIDFEKGYVPNASVNHQPFGEQPVWLGKENFLQVRAGSGRDGGVGLQSPDSATTAYLSQRFMPSEKMLGGNKKAIGRIAVSLDVRLNAAPVSSATGNAFTLNFGAFSKPDKVVASAVRLNIKDAGKLCYFGGDKEESTTVTLSKDVWTTLRAEIDYDNRVYSLSADGRLLVANASLRSFTNEDFGYVEIISGPLASSRAFCVDNLSIERLPASPALSQVLAKVEGTPVATPLIPGSDYIAGRSVLGQPRGGASYWEGAPNFLQVSAYGSPDGSSCLVAPVASPGALLKQHYTPSQVELGGDAKARGQVRAIFDLSLAAPGPDQGRGGAFSIRVGNDTQGDRQGCAARIDVNANGGISVYNGSNLVASGATLASNTWLTVDTLIDYDHKSVQYIIDGRPALTGKFFEPDADVFGRVEFALGSDPAAYRSFSISNLSIIRD